MNYEINSKVRKISTRFCTRVLFKYITVTYLNLNADDLNSIDF